MQRHVTARVAVQGGQALRQRTPRVVEREDLALREASRHAFAKVGQRLRRYALGGQLRQQVRARGVERVGLRKPAGRGGLHDRPQQPALGPVPGPEPREGGDRVAGSGSRALQQRRDPLPEILPVDLRGHGHPRRDGHGEAQRQIPGPGLPSLRLTGPAPPAGSGGRRRGPRRGGHRLPRGPHGPGPLRPVTREPQFGDAAPDVPGTQLTRRPRGDAAVHFAVRSRTGPETWRRAKPSARDSLETGSKGRAKKRPPRPLPRTKD